MDGSTNSANMEEQLILALYLNSTAENGKVSVCAKFLSGGQPLNGNVG